MSLEWAKEGWGKGGWINDGCSRELGLSERKFGMLGGPTAELKRSRRCGFGKR